MWQAAYAELFFTPVLWPDFTEEDFVQALDEYVRSQAAMRNGPDTGEGLFLSVFLLAYVLPFEFADCLYPVFG